MRGAISRVRGPAVACLMAAALVLAVTACGAGRGGRSDGGVESRADNLIAERASSTGLTRFLPAERPRLPRLRGRTLDGGRLDLATWRGRVVVINTWGSWCGPCREEAPGLRRAAQEGAATGVRFVGIDTRDNDAAARAFVREFGIDYPSLVDRDGRLMLAFGRTIPVSAVPSTVVVDTRGRIAARVIGAATYATLVGLIEDVQREKTPGRSSTTPGTP